MEVTNLLQAGDNEITVYTDNRTKPNSRWYVGCGIYRSVWLHMASAVSVAPHGIRAVTAALDGSSAVVEVSTALTGTADSVTYELADAEGRCWLRQRALNGAACRQRHYAVDAGNARPLHPARERHRQRHRRHGRAAHWHPHDSGKQQDRSAAEQSARTMKGGCIHHDLGILGAADHAAAERRRIRLMKESGFDAIRAAHNPLARRS